MEREKGGDIRTPAFSLVSECKVRAFYGFSGDKEGMGPAIESLGTKAFKKVYRCLYIYHLFLLIFSISSFSFDSLSRCSRTRE